MEFIITEKKENDSSWVNDILVKDWGSSVLVSRRKKYTVDELLGFIAEKDDHKLGMCLYRYENKECEIVLFESFEKEKGIGTALLEKLEEWCKERRIRRIWLITTNDNIDALRYYQKHGFELVFIYRNEIGNSRKLKPEIPYIGCYGIQIKDEIELERKL